MKFVVTGGAGFIGKNIVKNLLKLGHSVHVIDNLRSGKKENLEEISKKIEFHEIDILDFEGLNNISKNCNGIFHQASLVDVQESFQKPKEYHLVNVEGTKNILDVAKKNGLRVVFASSSSVYGNTKKIPIKETSALNPINPYGKTKLDMEILAENYANNGVEVIGLRYFNVYGKGQTSSYAGVITKFMEQLSKNKPPIINGDGTQVRDFVYVEDVAQANITAFQSNVKNGFFNIGTGIATSIKDLAYEMIKSYGVSLEPNFVKAKEGDIKLSQADVSYTQKLLGWHSQVTLQTGLRKLRL